MKALLTLSVITDAILEDNRKLSELDLTINVHFVIVQYRLIAIA